MKYNKLDKLKEAVEAGVIKEIQKGDLSLYHYSDRCDEEKLWDEFDGVPIEARGLILDKEGNVVARPYRKSFNLNQEVGQMTITEAHLLVNPIEYISEKVDGSLGIIYWHENKWRCATKGAFDSEQAKFAQNILNQHSFLCGDLFAEIQDSFKEYTILCEIVYPENRLIVDYGQTAGLIIHGLVHRDTGNEFAVREINKALQTTMVEFLDGKVFLRAADCYKFSSWDELVKKLHEMNGEDGEGFVAILRSGQKIKLKAPDYVKMSKTSAQFFTDQGIMNSFKTLLLEELKSIEFNNDETVSIILGSTLAKIEEKMQDLPRNLLEKKLEVANWAKTSIFNWWRELILTVYPVFSRLDNKERWEALRGSPLPEPVKGVAMYYIKNPDNKLTLEKFFIKSIEELKQQLK